MTTTMGTLMYTGMTMTLLASLGRTGKMLMMKMAEGKLVVG
jgi:hypothetical protein